MITAEKTATPDTPIQKRSLQQTCWCWVAQDVYKRFGATLGPDGLAVYMGLASYSNNRTQECWPALERLATDIGITVSRVDDAMQRLIQAGLVRMQARSGRSPLFVLLALPPVEEPSRVREDARVCPKEEELKTKQEEEKKIDLDAMEEQVEHSELAEGSASRQEEGDEEQEAFMPCCAMLDPTTAAPWTPYTVPEAVREEQCQVNCEGVAALRALLYPWEVAAERALAVAEEEGIQDVS